MFDPIKVPFGCVMLYNVVKLKPGVGIEDVEMVLGEMCNTVKNTYDGFIAGQVYSFEGFVSDEGSVSENKTDPHIAIVTFWDSFEEHEKSHGDCIFKEKFDKLVSMSDDAYEIGYRMLWQGDK